MNKANRNFLLASAILLLTSPSLAQAEKKQKTYDFDPDIKVESTITGDKFYTQESQDGIDKLNTNLDRQASKIADDACEAQAKSELPWRLVGAEAVFKSVSQGTGKTVSDGSIVITDKTNGSRYEKYFRTMSDYIDYVICTFEYRAARPQAVPGTRYRDTFLKINPELEEEMNSYFEQLYGERESTRY